MLRPPPYGNNIGTLHCGDMQAPVSAHVQHHRTRGVVIVLRHVFADAQFVGEMSMLDVDGFVDDVYVGIVAGVRIRASEVSVGDKEADADSDSAALDLRGEDKLQMAFGVQPRVKEAHAVPHPHNDVLVVGDGWLNHRPCTAGVTVCVERVKVDI